MNSTQTCKSAAARCLCLALAAALSQSALGKAFVIPHVLEKSGTINSTFYTFDTTFFLTYNASLNGQDKGSAQVDLYLYDEQTGELMQGAANPICGPCTFQLNAQNRKIPVRLEDLIVTNGGGFDTDVKLGFGVLVVSGADPDAVNVQGFVVNSHTGPFDVSVFGSTPAEGGGPPQTRRTFVLPHVLESSGRAASTSNAIDTTLYATYTGGLPGLPAGTGASLDLYLYDQATGKPMVGGGGGDVCNPCSYPLGTGAAGAPPRKVTIVLDDAITAAGGFGGVNFKQGFAVISVGGDDPAGVDLQGFVVNSHTSPFDLSVYVNEPVEVKTNLPPSSRRTFVLPHILEKSGLVSTQTFTFDTTLYATYSAGIAGTTQGLGATLDFYLYDDSGAPMEGLSHLPICNPCTFGLGTGPAGTATPRQQSIRIDDLISTRGGGFDLDSKTGYGVIVVGGDDPAAVELEGFVVNSHTGPFDLSVFGFNPQEVVAASIAGGGGGGAGGLASKAFVLPHILEKSGTINDTPFTFDTTLYATYTGGLPGSVSSNGATLKLYLYDSASGLPLTGATGQVCNPCTYDLSTAARKLSIRIDDLITTRGGGFGGQDKDAFGIVVLDHSPPDVALQGFVVNSHTSPFDLSVFGFEPQPLVAARMLPMPVHISPGADTVQISVPTVIGGHYALESKGNLDDPDWLTFQSFEGDGTVKQVTVPTSLSSRQFFRVNGM